MSASEDHFAPLAAPYAAYRPGYPDALFDWLAARCPSRERAWDCGCGSGQATLALSKRFREVIATDASAAQIAEAPPLEGVRYAMARAESSGIAAASVDLIAAAQALHWFDLECFYAEARRVGRPGAILAAWCYGTLIVQDAGIDALVQSFYAGTLGPYWPAERRHVEAGYRTLPFPADELRVPAFEMRARWPLPRLVGMLASWSAVARYRRELGADPVPAFARALEERWGDPVREREILWPLTVRAARLASG